MSIADNVLLPAEAARVRVRAELDVIDAAYARLRVADTDLVGNVFRVELAERLETQQRVGRGLSYRVFGEIADPPDGPQDPALAAGAKIGDLLWARLRINRGEIARRFRIAARIRPRRNLTGPPAPPALPQVADAVEHGAIGEGHIREITRALDRLPAKVAPADRDRAERTLVDAAREQDPNFVAALGCAIADCLNPDGDFCDEDRARRRALHLHRQGPDGMSRLTGCIDPQTRAYLEAVIAAVRPGHRQPETADPTAPDTRSAQQRNHDALKLVLRHGIESAKLGTHRGVPVTVIVTTKLGELQQAVSAIADPAAAMPGPARTGGGSRLPMRDLIAMAADSIRYLAVFGNHLMHGYPYITYIARSDRVSGPSSWGQPPLSGEPTDHRITGKMHQAMQVVHKAAAGCRRPDVRSSAAASDDSA